MLLCPVSKQCHGASVYYTACCCLFAVMTCTLRRSQRSSIVRVKRGGRVGVDAVVQVKPTSKCSVDSVVAPCWSSRQHAVSCKLELVTGALVWLLCLCLLCLHQKPMYSLFKRYINCFHWHQCTQVPVTGSLQLLHFHLPIGRKLTDHTVFNRLESMPDNPHNWPPKYK